MRISLIAALAQNGVIGLDNRLPWHLPADLKRFKALTMGHSLVMGRKTFESIGRPLPGRSILVVSRNPDYAPPGVRVVHSVDEALAGAGDEEVFVAGGGEIFRQTIGRAGRIYLTRIGKEFPGDTFFPAVDETGWRLLEKEDHQATEETPFAYSFEVWERK